MHNDTCKSLVTLASPYLGFEADPATGTIRMNTTLEMMCGSQKYMVTLRNRYSPWKKT